MAKMRKYIYILVISTPMVSPLLAFYKYESYTDLCTHASKIVAACVPKYNYNNLVKAIYSTPIAYVTTSFGVVPIVFLCIMMVVTPLIWFATRFCNPYVKLRTMYQKVDKLRKKLIKARKIYINVKKTSRADQVSALQQASENLTQDYKLQDITYKYYYVDEGMRTVKSHGKWHIIWPILYYCSAILGLVSLIYFIIGAVYMTSYGNVGFSIAKRAYNESQRITKTQSQSIDIVASNLIGAETTVASDFVGANLNKFTTSYEAFENELVYLRLVTEPLKQSFNLLQGPKSLIEMLGKILFFPSDPDNKLEYIRPGLDVMDELKTQTSQTVENQKLNEMSIVTINELIRQKQYPSKILEQLYNIDLTKFYTDIFSVLPEYVTELIILLGEKPNKWEFAKRSFAILKQFLNYYPVEKLYSLFVPCDSNGNNCMGAKTSIQDIIYNTTGYNISSFLGKEFNAANLLEYAVSAIRTWKPYVLYAKTSFDNYSVYIYHVMTISFDAFLSEMMDKKCTYVWCGIIPKKAYSSINTMKTWATVMVVFAILIIPLTIFITYVSCISCKKTGCISCSVWTCWPCYAFSVMFLVCFLICSIMSPMVIRPITNYLYTNLTTMADDTLAIVGKYVPLKATLEMKNTSYSTITPNVLQIDFSTVQKMINSFYFNATFDYEKLFYTVLHSKTNGVAQILVKLLDDFLPKEVGVSFVGTDMSGIFVKKAGFVLGTSIKFDGLNLIDYITKYLDVLVNGCIKFDTGIKLYGISKLIVNALQPNVDNFWTNQLLPIISYLNNIKSIGLPSESEICQLYNIVKIDYYSTSLINSFDTIDKSLNSTFSDFVYPVNPYFEYKLPQLTTTAFNIDLEFYGAHYKLEEVLYACVTPNGENLEVTVYYCLRKKAQNNYLEYLSQTANKNIGSYATLKINSLNDFVYTFSNYNCESQYNIEKMIIYVNQVLSKEKEYDPSLLPNIQLHDSLILMNRGVYSFISFEPTKPYISNQATFEADLKRYALNVAKFSVYCSAMQNLVNSNKIETSPIDFGTQVLHLSFLKSLVSTEIPSTIKSIKYINDKLLGKTPFQCPGDTFETTETPIIDKIIYNIKQSIDIILINTAYAADSNPIFNPLYDAITEHKAFTEVSKMTKVITTNAMSTVLSNYSFFTSENLNMFPSMTYLILDSIIEPFDSFSFAFYMFFIFSLTGTLFATLGYGWYAERYDNRKSKKGYVNIDNDFINYTNEPLLYQYPAPVAKKPVTKV